MSYYVRDAVFITRYAAVSCYGFYLLGAYIPAEKKYVKYVIAKCIILIVESTGSYENI